MSRLVCFFLALHSWVYFASAVDVAGGIGWNAICPNMTSLGRAKAILDDGKLAGDIARNGQFIIYDVPVGAYVLSVMSHDYLFDQLRIDISNESIVPKVRPFVLGTPFNAVSAIQLAYPVYLVPRQKHEYFLPPQSFNLMGMISNPMMLMMVFGGIMMLVMPYIMNNLDPESLQEIQETQSKISHFKDAVGNGDLREGISSFLENDEISLENQTLPAVKKQKAGKKSRRG